jgi:hypothetical protein
VTIRISILLSSLFLIETMSGQLKIHSLLGLAEVKVDASWKREGPRTGIVGNRFVTPTFFAKENTDPPSVVMLTIVDSPREALSLGKPDQMAKADSKLLLVTIVPKNPKEGKLQVGEIKVREERKQGRTRWIYTRRVTFPGNDDFTITGVIWKTERRIYFATTAFAENPLDRLDVFYQNWKESTRADEIYAESYRNRDQFLNEEQKAKLKKTLIGEWAGNLQLIGLQEQLDQEDKPETRKQQKLVKEHTESRKMRLIYHKLLTPEQRKKFDASMKRRMAK